MEKLTPYIERFIRPTVGMIGQLLGLLPKRYPTSEEAFTAGVRDFLNGRFPEKIMNLRWPQREDKSLPLKRK